jgi:hypothetical protein
MGTGLYLQGHVGSGTSAPAPQALLKRVEKWAVAHAGDPLTAWHLGKGHEGRSALFLKLHPAAEAVEVAALGRGRLLVSAKTSSAGPGYHAYLCDLLKRLGKALRVTWDPPEEEGDEGTRYFHAGDRAALEGELLRWLADMAVMVRENMSKGGGWYSVSMPLGHHYQSDDQVVTPLGFRDAAWFAAVADDPRAGIDIFPWWEEGQGAHYLLNRALCLMWAEVRWRPPINDDEIALYESVINLLRQAHALDPSQDYPWREWHEMNRHFAACGGEQMEPTLAAQVARRAARVRKKPLVGYRRRPVKVDLPERWAVTIPGSFAEEWEDNHATWSAWDSVCSLWVTTYTFLNKDGTPLTAEETLAQSRDRAGERFDYQGGKVIGRAFLDHVTKDEEDEGEASYWRLCGRSASAGHLAGFTICFTDPAYRQWALDTWHTIQHA